MAMRNISQIDRDCRPGLVLDLAWVLDGFFEVQDMMLMDLKRSSVFRF